MGEETEKKKLLQLLESIQSDKNANLLPTTLKTGVTCLGVEGNTSPLSITEDATAKSSDIANGITAYVNNEKVEGTITTQTPGHSLPITASDFGTHDDKKEFSFGYIFDEDTLFRDQSRLNMYVGYDKIKSASRMYPEYILAGKSMLDVEGTATSDATAVATDIVRGKTAYVNGEKITGTVREETIGFSLATSKIIDIENQSCLYCYSVADINKLWREGVEATLIVPYDMVATSLDLTPEMIVEGDTVLGVAGTTKPLSVTSDATATANDMVMGKTAYVNGEKITGTVVEDSINFAINATEVQNTDNLVLCKSTTDISRLWRPDATMMVQVPHATLATALDLTPEKIVTGNTILGISGTGIASYASLEELQTVIGTEGQLGVVYDGTTFDGIYQYTEGEWVELFSSRRYDGTLTPEEYIEAEALSESIKGTGEADA